MELTLRIDARQDGWAILVCLDGNPVSVLAEGLPSAQEAVQALVNGWTAEIPEAPDLTRYDEAVDAVGTLASRVDDVEAALGQVGERLNTAEDRIEAVGQIEVAPPVSGRRSLLPGRAAAGVGVGGQAAGGAVRPRPTIRRQLRTNELPEEQQDLGNRVHGQFFGGPTRGRNS